MERGEPAATTRRIAVDAMGGDAPPEANVEGAVRAARELGIGSILVGREELLRPLLKRFGAGGLPIELRHAEEVVAMNESPAIALRRKKGSSLRVAADLVKGGAAAGLVSAGNTGAVMATAMLTWGTIPGVDRPALAAVVPNPKGNSVILDVGANVDCKVHHLLQFAVMGSIFARAILGLSEPRVGLLNIGEEEGKGDLAAKQAHKVLKDSALNFLGNAEGQDVFNGRADVVVCDGFLGNVVLKVSEGLAETIEHILRTELSRTVRTRLGYALARPALKAFHKHVDYAEYGGAPLLGVRGTCIICHGRSNAKAIRNAIRVAHSAAQGRINEIIQSEIEILRQREAEASSASATA
jgi:glycerol-3-phosphate acyltransferase PlsX